MSSGICYERGDHWVLRVKKGFEVYRNGATHAVRVAQIGYTGDEGLARAVAEVHRREAGFQREDGGRGL